MFFSKKSKAPPLPANWPSPLCNKCDQLDCRHPNPPQPAKGIYQCQGIPGGFYCEGTYKVTTAMAEAADLHFKEQFRLEAEAKRKEKFERALNKEREHQEAVRQWYRDEQARKDMVIAAYPNYEPMRSRGRREQPVVKESKEDLGRREVPRPRPAGNKVPLDPRKYNQSWTHGRTQAQKEQEYYTDRIMQEMYPEYNVPQRWI